MVQSNKEIIARIRAELVRLINTYPVETAVMMLEELGGVVNSELKVYGV